ncbi:MAG: hypothetical protein GY679_01545 [Mycoplasma sp.]|nr:hypothetical protein [Mycoplasma sp.]
MNKSRDYLIREMVVNEVVFNRDGWLLKYDKSEGQFVTICLCDESWNSICWATIDIHRVLTKANNEVEIYVEPQEVTIHDICQAHGVCYGRHERNTKSKAGFFMLCDMSAFGKIVKPYSLEEINKEFNKNYRIK